MQSYNQAIRVLEEEAENASAAKGLCLEIAGVLYDLNRLSEATTFYQRAADLCLNSGGGSGLDYVHAREMVAKCLIEAGDYHNAVVALTETANLTIVAAVPQNASH